MKGERSTVAGSGRQSDVDRELRRLKALIAQQQERISALEGRPTAAATAAESAGPRSTRRQLLKLAGAAMVGAAGSAALRAMPAAAAQGDTLTVGTMAVQDQNNNTGIQLAGTATPESIFFANGLTGSGTGVNGVKGFAHNLGAGVIGYSTNFTGVYGYTKAGKAGVWGDNQGSQPAVIGTGNGVGLAGYTYGQGGFGIYGYTAATAAVAGYFVSKSGGGSGVYSYSENYVGVLGTSNNYAGIAGVALQQGTGVIAMNLPATGWDLKIAGSGRIAQITASQDGLLPASSAPDFTPALPGYFELVRTVDGAIWADRGAGSAQAAWKRVNAVRFDTDDGRGDSFKPYRVIDTRTLGGPKAPGAAYSISVAGQGSGASHIPADAVAVIGNLTATGYTANGFLAIMPDGIPIGTGAGKYDPAQDPSSLNFLPGQFAIANNFTCGLKNGKLQVYVGQVPSHFIVDITAYVQ